MFCPYCGQRFGERDNFCTRCGRPRPVLSERRAPGAGPAPSAVPASPGAAAPAAPFAPSSSPAPVRQGAPALGPRVPAADPRRPADGTQTARNPYAKPASRGDHRARDWGGAATAAGTVIALAASLACAALLFASSLVGTPLFASASGDGGEVVHVVLTSIDPGLSVVVSSFLDRDALDLLDLVLMTPAFSEPLSAGYVTVCVGVVAGFAAGGAALLLAGAVATLVGRRPSVALALGNLALCTVALAVAGAASWVDKAAMGVLRNDLSMAFATAGVQLSGSAHVSVALPALYVAAGLGALGFVAALWARSSWGRRHRPRRAL